MPFALNFFHDQIVAGGSSAPALPAAHRLLYVRYGRVVINGQTLNIDEATYCEGPVTLQSAADWSQVWRWELVVPNSTLLLLDGSGVLSSLRMSRVITHLAMLDGSRWLSDSIKSSARPVASPIVTSIPAPEFVVCWKELSTSRRTRNRLATCSRATPGGGPDRIQWLPGGRTRWRQSSCEA